MQFKTILSITATATIAISGAHAGLQDPRVYARDVAPTQLSRISEYRSQHADGLDDPQMAVLDRIEAVIVESATDDIPALEEACDAAFGAAECKYLLTGKGKGKRAAAVLSARQKPLCECSDESDWCDDGFRCSYQYKQCSVNDGCGTLGWYDCDGLCIPK
ncbi:hypothetical protein DL762_004804 [Monosporascus cannonballus]|uniref:Uncharacterized protein n=1 Tax=Monosporascus cannonballus TaxID=155416 RepID=A0ABY0H6N1_9PEZI|nr:hypothetical protein DL762_004804 [Monosporascus cannonballus]